MFVLFLSKGGTIHWERDNMPKQPRVPFFFPIFSPAEVEITAYMLLSMASGPSISQEDLTTMAQISMWLARQQNSHGGFPSTQVTMKHDHNSKNQCPSFNSNCTMNHFVLSCRTLLSASRLWLLLLNFYTLLILSKL